MNLEYQHLGDLELLYKQGWSTTIVIEMYTWHQENREIHLFKEGPLINQYQFYIK